MDHRGHRGRGPSSSSASGSISGRSGSGTPGGTTTKTVATESNQQRLNMIAGALGGGTQQLQRRLARLDAELKADAKGQQEFDRYRARLEAQRADALARVERNRAWVADFERQAGGNGGGAGAFEAQYARLCDEIAAIYESAKEFHAHGIGLLVENFKYHVAYKRWSDTFSAVPFKPA